METGEHAKDRRLVNAGGERDAGSQRHRPSGGERPHLPDHQTHPRDRVPKEKGKDNVAQDGRGGIPCRVESYRYADPPIFVLSVATDRFLRKLTTRSRGFRTARITPGLLIKLEGVNAKNGQVENSVVRERMGVASVVGRTGTGNREPGTFRGI